MVPPSGIEPELPKEPDFESGASTNSAKGAGQRASEAVGACRASVKALPLGSKARLGNLCALPLWPFC